MKVKKMITVLVILAGSIAAVSAHDKGDMMLNIEPRIGIAIPDIGIVDRQTGIRDRDIPGMQTFSAGMDAGLQVSVHYYFFNFFAINTGLGFNIFTGIHNAEESILQNSGTLINVLVFGYASIPIGFRFSLGAFAIGGGLTGNMPIDGGSAFQYSVIGSGSGGSSLPVDNGADESFSLNPYMGWYFDVGFDLSGRRGRKGGFGMLARFEGSFSDKIAETGNPFFQYDPFRYFSVSLVFQAGIELANLPLGGK
ncbi:MAG: hypothetical protein LBH57_05335 [Treponema sp.]|jgi:hypothetical protein|nr:hypothetical protein [Treponema sp.]